MKVAGAASSPCRPRSARYAEKGYPNYAEEPDVHDPAAVMEAAGAASSPRRPRSARYSDKGCPNYEEEPDVRDPAAAMELAGSASAAASSPRRPRSARYSEKGYPNYAEEPDVRDPAAATEVAGSASAAASSPCRPRSARYAQKGYPNYAEPDGRRMPRRKAVAGGGGRGFREENPAARRGRKRGRPAAGNALPLIVQGDEEEVARDEGRKRLRTGDDAASATAAGKEFPVIADGEEDVAPADGPADERGDVDGKSWRLRVKETLRVFCTNYLHFVQKEQRREEAAKQELKASRSLKSQVPGDDGRTKHQAKQDVKRGLNKGGTTGRKPPKRGNIQDSGGHQEGKRTTKRPDLKALKKMQECGAVLHREKVIGHIPGIDVGDQFCSRAEMVALGIHSHWLNGIDYMGTKYRDKKGCENFMFPLATCIVMSGAYEDDVDNADEIIYTGEGCNNWLGNSCQKTEQTMLRGNLALKNSKDNGNPIRVIRGHKEKRSYAGKVYTYDGLYKVLDCWSQKGVRGQLIFKYRLKRLEDQSPLTTSQRRAAARPAAGVKRVEGQRADLRRSGGGSGLGIGRVACGDDSQVATTVHDDSGKGTHGLITVTETHICRLRVGKLGLLGLGFLPNGPRDMTVWVSLFAR